MQEVHTLSRLGVPLTMARTVWMFGFQRRRVRRCECETLLPKPGLLPHTSQTEATGCSIDRSGWARSRTGPGSRRSLPDARAGREPAVIVVGRFYAGGCDLAPRTADRVAGSQDGRQAGRSLRPAHGRRPAAALPAALLHPGRAYRPVLAARGRPRHRAGPDRLDRRSSAALDAGQRTPQPDRGDRNRRAGQAGADLLLQLPDPAALPAPPGPRHDRHVRWYRVQLPRPLPAGPPRV